LRLKTKDQVTFSISLKVFYKVVDDVEEAYKSEYNLNSFEDQMISVATDSAIPVANSVELGNVFNSKEDILEKAEEALTKHFNDYGIIIDKVLSDEPQLPTEVENSANEVIAAQRRNDAAKYKAEPLRQKRLVKQQQMVNLLRYAWKKSVKLERNMLKPLQKQSIF
jgi:regulator of protease activity HflC (stomatin/prohibitin superfamily)